MTSASAGVHLAAILVAHCRTPRQVISQLHALRAAIVVVKTRGLAGKRVDVSDRDQA
jgi:hypothetical protein